MTCLLAILLLVSLQAAGSNIALPSSFLNDLSIVGPLCDIGSPPPLILVNTSSDLLRISSLRHAYPSRLLVAIALTASNILAPDGVSILQSAYDLKTNQLVLGSSMACSYIFGTGIGNSRIYYNNSNTGNSALLVSLATDIILVDITIDRYPETFNKLVGDCANASYYGPSSNPILQSSFCLNIASTVSAQQITGNSNAIRASNTNRVGFIRVGTAGGVSFDTTQSGYGSNNSVSSSDISSPGNGVFAFNMPGFLQVYNNTISSPWGSGIFTNQQTGNSWFAHNRMSTIGWSCIYSRRSVLQIIEFNDCRNFSYLPGVGGGAAAYYSWNAFGWHAWGRIVRNNYFLGYGQKCFYLDSTDSNTIFQNNLCVTGPSETNGGRYNLISNNVHIYYADWGNRLGDINCPQLAGSPNTWYSSWTCRGLLSTTQTGDYAFLPNVVWSNYFPNGTLKNSNLPAYTGSYVQEEKQFAYPTWCNRTAGPNATNCVASVPQYVLNGVTYEVSCESLPSENTFGFAVLYTAATPPSYFGPGWGCTCPGPGCSPINSTIWPNYYYSAASIVLKLNYFNVSWYQIPSYGGNSLFGVNFPYQESWKIEPRMLNITSSSALGLRNPELMSIQFQRIGLELFCTMPSAPTNGEMTCSSAGQSNILPQSVCSFTCVSGYTLVGHQLVTCQADGIWNFPLPTLCSQNACPAWPVAAPGNGSVLCTLAYAVGSYCTFDCNSGYLLTSFPLICGSDGVWRQGLPEGGDAIAPTCTLMQNYCSNLPTPSNGALTCTNFGSIGSQCTYSCDLGFTPTGQQLSFICGASTPTTGSWNGVTPPVCTPITNYCSATTAPTHGSVLCNGRRIGSQCSYSCPAGLLVASTSQSSVIANCAANSLTLGMWFPSPPSACSTNQYYCPAISTLGNGTITFSSNRALGSTATFSCNIGYQLIGRATLPCSQETLLTGIWNGSAPLCVPAISYCSIPTPPTNGAITCTSEQILSVCTYTCNAGYYLSSGSPNATCISYNSASGIFTNSGGRICSRITNFCPVILPYANVTVPCANNYLGATCSFGCSTLGNVLVGSSTVTCTTSSNGNGVWVPASLPSCQSSFSFCPPIHVPANSYLSCSATQAVSSICQLACSPGYLPASSSAVTCLSGSPARWNASAIISCNTLLVSYCPSIPIPTLLIASGSTSCTNSRYLGSVCSWLCAAGYTDGMTSTTCVADTTISGVWSGNLASQCIPIVNYCPSQILPMNSLMSCSEGGTLGSICSASCMSGYVIGGGYGQAGSIIDPVTCLSGNRYTGVWTSWLASNACLPAFYYCTDPNLLAVPGTVILCNGLQQIGSNCTLLCGGGSSSTIVCSQSPSFGLGVGTWVVTSSVAGGCVPQVSTTQFPFTTTSADLQIVTSMAGTLDSTTQSFSSAASPEPNRSAEAEHLSPGVVGAITIGVASFIFALLFLLFRLFLKRGRRAVLSTSSTKVREIEANNVMNNIFAK